MRAGPSIVVLLSSLVLDAAVRAAPGDNAVGINTHIPSTEVVDLVDDLGAHWIRVDNNWFQQSDPCSQGGGISFIAPLDTAVSYAISKGISVYMTLAYTPACASTGNGDGGANNNDVPVAAEYAEYVHAAVAHYRAMGVRHFGIWNEANLDSFFEGTPTQYVQNVVIPGMDAVVTGCAAAAGGPFTDCLSLGPDLAHVGDYDVYLDDTLTQMEAAGRRFDIFAHHIYQKFWVQIWDGASFINALYDRRFDFTRRSLMDVLTDVGLTDAGGEPLVEIWITETGHQVEPPTDGPEMDRQADHYMSVIDEQLAKGWYTNTFFYEILDSLDQLDGYGITRAEGGGSYYLKPAYLALQARIIAEPELSGGGSTECSDGVDNDGDSLADLADPGCSGPTDDDESDDPTPPQPAELVALPAGTITVDGSFGDWNDDYWIELTSPDDYVSVDTPPGDASDLSCRLAARWDGSAVYLAFEVTDNAHENSNSADALWLGDSVQAAFDAARNGGLGYDDTDDYEFGWANVGTAVTYRFHAPSGAAAATNTYAVVRTGTTTRYEIRMPAADLGLGSFSDGSEVGFTMLVNDDDGSGRRGYIEFTPGIGQFKDPDQFGVLRLYAEPPPPPDAGVGDDGGTVTPDAGIGDPDATGGNGADDADGGCCSTNGNQPSSWLLALLVVGWLRRRR